MALATDTHKFESRYLDGLVGPLPETAARYRDRSPLHHADRLARPVLLLQGEDDRVVPPSQAEVLLAALTANGVPHAFVLFPGEGHGFRRSETLVEALETELAFYGQVLGFTPADDLPRRGSALIRRTVGRTVGPTDAGRIRCWLGVSPGARQDGPMRVLVTEKIADSGLQRLRDAGHEVDIQLDLTPESLLETLPGAHALIIRSATKVTAEALAAAPTWSWWAGRESGSTTSMSRPPPPAV